MGRELTSAPVKDLSHTLSHKHLWRMTNEAWNFGGKKYDDKRLKFFNFCNEARTGAATIRDCPRKSGWCAVKVVVGDDSEHSYKDINKLQVERNANWQATRYSQHLHWQYLERVRPPGVNRSGNAWSSIRAKIKKSHIVNSRFINIVTWSEDKFQKHVRVQTTSHGKTNLNSTPVLKL